MQITPSARGTSRIRYHQGVIASPHTYQYTRFYDNIIRLIMCKLNNVVISSDHRKRGNLIFQQIASLRSQ
jgi:hypothetical protein